MANIDLDAYGFVDPGENIRSIPSLIENTKTNISNKLNSLTNNVGLNKPTGGLKVPAKLFDPIYGPNVIFGFIITSDFMSFCNGKPFSRVGDLVFVTGIVGDTIVSEIGIISTGCLNSRQNAIGNGKPFGDISIEFPFGKCGNTKLFDSKINADLLNPVLIDRIDACLGNEDVSQCIKNIVLQIQGSCAEKQTQNEYPIVNDLNLEDKIKQIGLKNLDKLNKKLQQGFCGNDSVSNLNLSFDSLQDFLNKKEKADCNAKLDTNLPHDTPIGVNVECTSEYMKYISSKLNNNLKLDIESTATGYISKADVSVISQVADIKIQYDNDFKSKINNIINVIPEEFNGSYAENINLAYETIESLKQFISIDINENPVVNIQKLKLLKSKLVNISNKTLDVSEPEIQNDSELKSMFGDILSQRQYFLEALIPPNTEIVCPPKKKDDPICSDLDELNSLVNNSVEELLELVNGSQNKIGLISKTLSDIGINDIKQATGVAGLNPIDSMTLYRRNLLDKIDRCIRQTLSVHQYLDYCDNTNGQNIDLWELFIQTFSSAPRHPTSGDLLNTAPLENILQQIQSNCLTMPQKSIERYALEIVEMGSDIRNFNFISMDPELVGTSPSLSQMVSNPSILIPSSNIGTIIGSAGVAIQQAIADINLIKEQIKRIIIPKEEDLNEMRLYANRIIQMAIDSLKSLQGCLPALPCIQFEGLFNLDASFSLGIGLPNIKIPPLDLSFPTDFNFRFPIKLPPLIPATKFNPAVQINIPDIKLPRLPTPPVFPPVYNIKTIRLPNINIDSGLDDLFNKLNKLKPYYEIPLPQIQVPQLLAIVIPPIKIKIPGYSVKFGGAPLPNIDIKYPKFPIELSIKVPFEFNLNIPLPSIDIQLNNLPQFPLLNIPKYIFNIPKINVPFSGGKINISIPNLAIPFPSITIPSLCGDDGKTIEELLQDGKNLFNRITNIGIGGGRPNAVANCSMWVSPHFRGWIAPIPCVAFETIYSQCTCLT